MKDIKNKIMEFKRLSTEKLEDIQARESELVGVSLEDHRPVDVKSKEDSLILVIDKIKKFLKEYDSYINSNSQALFVTPKLNEEFDKLVTEFTYWYDEVNKEYPLDNQLNITNEDICAFFIRSFDLFSDKKSFKESESKPNNRNLTYNLIKFIDELRNKINDTKKNIKSIFKDTTNDYYAKYSENKFNYKLFIDYLKNGLIDERYIESRAFSNLFHGKIDKNILNEFKESEAKVITILQDKNISDSDYDLGLKIGLLYILYNAVNKLYRSTFVRRGQDNETDSIFTRLKESVEKADVSYNELETVFKNLDSLYSTLENVLAPVSLAEDDFNKLFESTHIEIPDALANFIHDFNLEYITDMIDVLKDFSGKINEASKLVNSIMVNMTKNKADRDPSLNIKEMETAKLLNINELIKNSCNKFDQYDLHLQTAISKLTKLKK